ncbi:hypothetical protein [Nitrosomonas nitrosa]|nr:hypothetical protein [Nitrosomonas nitrosa]
MVRPCGQQPVAHLATFRAPRPGKLHRSPNTRAVRPEALATEFLVVLN